MKAVLMAAVALLVGMPALAQQHNHPVQRGDHAQRPGMMEHCPMMGGVSPAMLLGHADALKFSADQVQRLEALRDQSAGPAHMEGAMAAHRQAAELLRAEQPDLAAYEAKLREAADHMVQNHISMARTSVAARAVLTPEQRAGFASLDHAAMGHSGGHGHGAMHGERHAGMMSCPMMGGKSGASAEAEGDRHP
jgi:Spy/CpxP family protein refolding chaperone